jgi:hypothetical protein
MFLSQSRNYYVGLLVCINPHTVAIFGSRVTETHLSVNFGTFLTLLNFGNHQGIPSHDKFENSFKSKIRSNPGCISPSAHENIVSPKRQCLCTQKQNLVCSSIRPSNQPCPQTKFTSHTKILAELQENGSKCQIPNSGVLILKHSVSL